MRNRTQAASQARERGLLDGDGLSTVEAIARPQTNLPAQVTTFIGREKQIREIADLIRDEAVRPRLSICSSRMVQVH